MRDCKVDVRIRHTAADPGCPRIGRDWGESRPDADIAKPTQMTRLGHPGRRPIPTDVRAILSDHTLWSPTKLMYVRRPFGPNAEPHAFKSVIRMIATTRPSLAECSIVSLLQVQTKFFLAVKVLPSCTTRSSPSVI